VIGRLFKQQVSIEPFTGEGAHGALYGPAVTVRCRVEEAEAYRQGQDGSADRHEVDPSTVVYLPYEANCPARSLVTLPSGQVGVAAEVHQHAQARRLRHLKVVVR
jgi:hypothetical protein